MIKNIGFDSKSNDLTNSSYCPGAVRAVAASLNSILLDGSAKDVVATVLEAFCHPNAELANDNMTDFMATMLEVLTEETPATVEEVAAILKRFGVEDTHGFHTIGIKINNVEFVVGNSNETWQADVYNELTNVDGEVPDDHIDTTISSQSADADLIASAIMGSIIKWMATH